MQPSAEDGATRARRDAGFLRPQVSLVIGLILAVPASAANEQPAGGLYEIEAYTMMPHLDEMRRIRKFEQTCVQDGDPTGLFPVMRQIAFRGCALVPSGTDDEYRLACQTDLVATGTALLSAASENITGTLAVKMGGKNMTFSQHTSARRIGPCGAE